VSKRTKRTNESRGADRVPPDFQAPDLEALGVTMDEFVEACRWFVEHFASLNGLSQNQVNRLKRRERRRALERWLRKQRARDRHPHG